MAQQDVKNAPGQMAALAAATTSRPVWRDMDQRMLDDAYDQAVHAVNRDYVTARRAPMSARAIAAIGAPQRVAYGTSGIEKLDIYRTSPAQGGLANLAPINIFVHGGAWRNGAAANYAYQAEMFVHAGAHHVILDFTSVDAAGGDLFPMVEQVRRAIAWVYRNAQSFGGDRERIYLTAHSSGSHLSGCALIHDWEQEGLPRDILKGAALLSGMYDLEPVRLSKRSSYVAFTDAMEQDLSAMRHIDRVNTPVILFCGTLESPEFQRQSADFHAALTGAGKPSKLVIATGYNHFELPETLASPYGLVGREVLAQMGLSPKM